MSLNDRNFLFVRDGISTCMRVRLNENATQRQIQNEIELRSVLCVSNDFEIMKTVTFFSMTINLLADESQRRGTAVVFLVDYRILPRSTQSSHWWNHAYAHAKQKLYSISLEVLRRKMFCETMSGIREPFRREHGRYCRHLAIGSVVFSRQFGISLLWCSYELSSRLDLQNSKLLFFSSVPKRLIQRKTTTEHWSGNQDRWLVSTTHLFALDVTAR